MVAEPSHLEEDQLAERVADGDSEAFAELVRRHTTRFYRIAYGILRDKDDAEDMVQTAFLKYWNQPQKWERSKKTHWRTWFYRVVVNTCLDHLKKKKPIPIPEDFNLVDETKNHEAFMEKNQKQQMVEQVIATLPERQRLALQLCFYEGLSNQEAAQIMNLRLKALQSLLVRAKQTLKLKIQSRSREVA